MKKLKQHPLKFEDPVQFTFHSIKVSLQDGSRTMIHFKRMPQGEFDFDKNSQNSLYTNINKFIKFKCQPDETEKSSSQLMDSGDVPINRTLIIISFDHQIDEKVIMKVFSLNGRVRRIYKGTMKIRSSDLNSDLKYLNNIQINNLNYSEFQINVKKKKVYMGLVIYKNEYDLTQCFNLDQFQERIQKKFFGLNKLDLEEGKQLYQDQLFSKYEQRDEQKDKYIQEAQQDGFQVVTDKFGNFDLNKEPQEFKSKAARKRKSKKTVEISEDLYKFQTELREMKEAIGDDGSRSKSAKELLKAKKDQLKKEFQDDKQKLINMKKVKI